MILPVVKYGHPALRQKGARIEKIAPAIRQLIEDMLETMYAAAGVGLAAQQVGQALQLTVIDVRDAKDRPSTLELNGQPADLAQFMPLVLMNPQITPVGEPAPGPEGCLSFPEIYADIVRPASVDVVGLNAKGERLEFQTAIGRTSGGDQNSAETARRLGRISHRLGARPCRRPAAARSRHAAADASRTAAVRRSVSRSIETLEFVIPIYSSVVVPARLHPPVLPGGLQSVP